MKRNTAGKSTPTSGSKKDQTPNGKDSQGSLSLLYGVVGIGIASGLAFLAYSKLSASGPVITLTEDSFPGFVSSNPEGALVYFYIPTCSHCKELTPHYEAAAVEVKAAGGAPFAKVNADELPALAKKFSIDRYPTMLWFRKGENVLEVGPTTRTKEKLVEYVDWASQPLVVEFQTMAEFDEAVPTFRQTLQPNMAPLIVGFEGAQPGLYDTVELAAEKLRGKVAFLFVREAHPDGTGLRTYAGDANEDQEYIGGYEPDSVYKWAKRFEEAAKAKRKASSAQATDQS